MGITNFPNGISSFGMPVVGGGHIPFTTGSYFFVSSVTGSDSNPTGADPDHPFATIDYAIGKCTASKGDVIVVMPGHSETIAIAGGITADVIGVSIVGVGAGTLRPIISWSATDSTLLITAANVTFDNFQFQCAKDSLVSGISSTAAGTAIRNSVFTSPTSTDDALIWVITSAAADDFVFENNAVYSDHAGPTEVIRLVGADRAKILNNYIKASASTAVINGITTESLDILIKGNTLCNSVIDKLLIDLVASCTGRIELNNGTVVSTAAWAAAAICDAANCQLAENYVSDAVGETGKLLGTVSA